MGDVYLSNAEAEVRHLSEYTMLPHKAGIDYSRGTLIGCVTSSTFVQGHSLQMKAFPYKGLLGLRRLSGAMSFIGCWRKNYQLSVRMSVPFPARIHKSLLSTWQGLGGFWPRPVQSLSMLAESGGSQGAFWGEGRGAGRLREAAEKRHM